MYRVYINKKVKKKLEIYKSGDKKTYLKILNLFEDLNTFPIDKIKQKNNIHKIKPSKSLIHSKDYIEILENEEMYSVKIGYDKRILLSISDDEEIITIYDIIKTKYA